MPFQVDLKKKYFQEYYFRKNETELTFSKKIIERLFLEMIFYHAYF